MKRVLKSSITLYQFFKCCQLLELKFEFSIVSIIISVSTSQFPR